MKPVKKKRIKREQKKKKEIWGDREGKRKNTILDKKEAQSCKRTSLIAGKIDDGRLHPLATGVLGFSDSVVKS